LPETLTDSRISYPDRFAKEDSLTTRKIQGITLAFPLQVKFSSDRINNFKVYMMGGGKLEYDFAANAGEKNAEKQISILGITSKKAQQWSLPKSSFSAT
jgi:hypothetical protein